MVQTDLGRPPDGLASALDRAGQAADDATLEDLKNTSAGIMDRDVNARTLAVSTEYCDANAWTPSGSV
jgi:hypothetical protein